MEAMPFALLLLKLPLDAQLDGQHCRIERSHRETIRRSNAWLPILGKSLFGKHRPQVVNTSTEDREHCRRAGIAYERDPASKSVYTYLALPNMLWKRLSE